MIVEFNSKRFSELAEHNGDQTLEAISARTGLDKAVLSRLLNGRRQPTLRTAKVAAIAYGHPLDDLITVRDAA